jgi:hypothetical protein
MTFSTGLLVLGLVLVGFAAHGHGSEVVKDTEQTVATPAASGGFLFRDQAASPGGARGALHANVII